MSIAISNCSARTSATGEDTEYPLAAESSLKGFCDDVDGGARFAEMLDGVFDGVL